MLLEKPVVFKAIVWKADAGKPVVFKAIAWKAIVWKADAGKPVVFKAIVWKADGIFELQSGILEYRVDSK